MAKKKKPYIDPKGDKAQKQAKKLAEQINPGEMYSDVNQNPKNGVNY